MSIKGLDKMRPRRLDSAGSLSKLLSRQIFWLGGWWNPNIQASTGLIPRFATLFDNRIRTIVIPPPGEMHRSGDLESRKGFEGA